VLRDSVDLSHQAATLVEILRRRAHLQPYQRAFTFLIDGEGQEAHISYAALDRRARAIAAALGKPRSEGERALLLYPPGLDYVAGLFGCLYAGFVAVPAYPPDPARLDRTLPRLQTIASDAQATVALTTSAMLGLRAPLCERAPDFTAKRWVATDDIEEGRATDWQDPGTRTGDLAILQYTSGSTARPRGVMLTHENVVQNLTLIATAMSPGERFVSWAPPYHDLGLVAGLLFPVYAGAPSILMSPIAFLQRPLRWLKAITRYRATVSGGPNFAYDLCVRKTTPAERATLDLATWSLAFNSAEPVRLDTLERFVAAFGPYGFRREAFYPCYGLAEATLVAIGGRRAALPVALAVDREALEAGRVIEVPSDREGAKVLVGSGSGVVDTMTVIVDPELLIPCPPGHVGEIWLRVRSMGVGYWNQPEETRRTFAASLADTGEGQFLRTGDLGFIYDGEVFITGRLKDVVIIRGRNLYPQDIELTVQHVHPALRPGGGAAFSMDVGGEERLVVVQELDPRVLPVDTEAVASDVRQAVSEAYGVAAYAVVLIRAGTLPKTSSGKVQRGACRSAFLSRQLETVWPRA